MTRGFHKGSVTFLVVIAAWIKATSCDNKNLEAISEQASTVFGLKLLRSLPRNSTANHVISPLGLAFVLSLAQAGAKGDTSRQIEDLLGYTSKSLPLESYEQLAKSIRATDTSGGFEFADVALLKPKVTIRDSYKELVSKHGDAIVVSGNKEGIEAANARLKKLTKGKFQKVPEQASADGTLMFLANFVYFKGSWEEKFHRNNTQKDTFHNADGSESRTDFMFTGGKFLHVFDEVMKAAIVCLPYIGNTTFILVVPTERDGLANVIEKLDASRVRELRAKLALKKVELKMPKLKLSGRSSLKNVLQKLGVKSLFDSTADLSGISEAPLKVNDIQQSTNILVDEEGSTADAETVAHVGPLSNDVEAEVTADHPFLFFIVKRMKMTILFEGLINKL